MHNPRGLFLCALVALVGATGPGAAQAQGGIPLFERRSDDGERGTLELSFDARAVAELGRLHARGASFVLDGLPLPGGIEARLTLRPVNAMPADARAQVVEADGSVTWLAPSVRCFSGWIRLPGASLDAGEAFLGISEDALHGFFRVGTEQYFLSSDDSARGHATLARQTDPFPSFSCGVEIGPRGAEVEADPRERLLAGPTLELAQIFLEADQDYRASFASNQACIDYTVLLLTAVSEIYRRDLGVWLRIPDGYLRVWNTPAPWGPITGVQDLSSVYGWWQSPQNPLRALPRAAVHVLTHPIFGGTARGIDGLCSSVRAYEISSLAGRFPYPIQHTHRDNWDLLVVAHELGHTFGSMHSADYVPPIECQDGSGPDSGTIMSYCNTQFGTAAVGMRFHLREQQRMRGHIFSATCLRRVPLARGDYDADGSLDLDDLLSANAVLHQGFRSLGAEETFDMDADGDFDLQDRDLLAALVGVAPASATPRNGSGVNPACLAAPGAPVLGAIWRPTVSATSAGQLTGVLLCDQPHAGLATPFGEFLGLPPAQGGTLLWNRTVVASGLLATFELPIPSDLALIGQHTVLQGVRLGPPSAQLCNALDLVLGPFE